MSNTFDAYTATEIVEIMRRFQRLKDDVADQFPLNTPEKATYIVDRLNSEFTERELEIIATQSTTSS